jgi:hypothetical protein
MIVQGLNSEAKQPLGVEMFRMIPPILTDL